MTLGLTLAIAGAVLVAPCGSPTGVPQDLDVTIQVVGKPGPGAPAAITFTLVRRGKTAVNVLDGYTPLEGLRGKLFEVTRDGKVVPYRGILVKRGDSDQTSYQGLAPRGPTRGHGLPGRRLRGRGGRNLAITADRRGNGDVSPEGAPIPRPREAHRGPRIRSDTVTFVVVP